MESNQFTPRIASEKRPVVSVGVIGWLHKNLFNTWYNSILTIVALWLIWISVSNVFMWAVWNAKIGFGPESCEGAEGACWSMVVSNWYVFLVGTYTWEERWRPFLCIGLVILLTLLSMHPVLKRKLWLKVAWLLSPVVIIVMLRGGFSGMPEVDSTQWGGLVLTLILSVLGIFFSFPIGVLLALGRRSQKMPVVKSLCVAYIEIIRAVPLITILFMSSVMLPLFFPEGWNMDKVLRAQIGIILFIAAYTAEIVRGGLQAIPSGQEEAAQALGLNYFQTMVFIILPQALRIMIPPLVSQAIGLFKDTSLVGIIGLIDFLAIEFMVSNNPDWVGKEIEGYVFIATVYWAFCFAVSRYAHRLEKRLKVGHH